MHLPYIRKVFGADIKLVPLMIGSLPAKTLPHYAKALLTLFQDPKTAFIVSSDFCHWGCDFEYTFRFKDEPTLYKSIEKLDRRAFEAIESHSVKTFRHYLDETENTICGQEPILLLLAIIEQAQVSGQMYETKFVKYDQSEQITSEEECSVSYGASYTILK